MRELNYFCNMQQLRYMANNKDIKKDKPKKEKKKRKPIYEIHGFVLTIPEERLKEMLLEMSKPNPEKE